MLLASNAKEERKTQGSTRGGLMSNCRAFFVFDASVIFRWIAEEYETSKNFSTQISHEKFPKDEDVAGVFPKEREGKNEPRLFGLMQLMKSLYIVLTEQIISEFFLPLYPEITMTYDQITHTNRVHQTTKRYPRSMEKKRQQ